jgi:translocation and assembly module TamB
MSLLKKVIITFLIIIVLLIGAVITLLSTSSGIRFLINTAVDYVPGLSIAKVEGNLKDLTLSDIVFQMDGVDVKAEQLALGIDFSCLTSSKICINNLSSRNVDVNVNTALIPVTPDEPPSEPITELSTPYPIELSTLALNGTKVNVDGMEISLDTFSTGALWQGRSVTLTPTLIDNLLIILPKDEAAAEPKVEKSEPEQPLGKMLHELFSQPLLSELPEVNLPVDITIQQIEGKNLQLVSNGEKTMIDSVLLKGNTERSNVNIDTFKVNAPQGTVALIGKATLADNWPLSLTLNSALNIPELRGEKVKATFAGEVVGDLKLSVNVSGPVSVHLSAETSLAKPEMPLSLTVESKKIQWPITGKADYQADNLRLRLTGKATDYVLSLRTDLSGAEVPPAQMTLDGKGNVEQFRLSRLRLSALEGKAELSGVADWSKAISWNTLLTLDGINTIKQWPEWPATLQGKVTSKGSVHGGSWQLELPEINLTGIVNKQKLAVSGSVRGNAANQWRIPGLLIALGNNRIEAKGELGKTWQMDANVNAPNLNESVPGLRGSVIGALKLRGTQAAPQLLTNLTLSGLKWQDLSVAKISLNGEVVSAKQVSGDLKLSLERLVQGDTRIKLMTLTAKGNENSHQLVLNADGRPVSGQLTLSGQFNRAQQLWKGHLSQTNFATPLGQWRLSGQLPLEYNNSAQKAVIGIHCWLNEDAELCLPKAAQVGKSGQARIELKRFDLRILRRILQGTELKGGFTGEVDLSWADNGQLPQGKVVLKGNGVEIVENVDGRKMPIAFDDIRLNADLNNQRVNLDWLLKLNGNGQFIGNIRVANPQTTRTLSGEVNFDHLSLSLLKPMLMENEQAAGILNGKLRLAGNSKAPQILGNLNLDNVALDTQWSPVTVTEGYMRLNFTGFGSDLKGLFKTRRGELNLNGNADWRKVDAWRAKITAKGDRIRIDMPPMVQLDVSPDVVIEATPDLLKLTGTVAIPWAKIKVEEIPPSAVGVSSDEVILDNSLKPVTKQSSSIPISSDLMIKIGPNVGLDAFGLKSSLQGDLKVIQDNKGLGLHGEINLNRGSFRAYGQDLLINKGLIIFAGPPDQPQLNIEAIRNPEATEDGVTAGLRVTGFADRPKLEIYSDPAMSQEAALSYLLRGQGLNAANDDNAMMTSMLIGLGVAQSGKLVGKIGETFGVKDLSLDTQGVGDSSQVVVSGYVLPGLQVKYGVGIFDSLATLTLRYRLMPRLYLEAVSGLDQALDVLYQFEF